MEPKSNPPDFAALRRKSNEVRATIVQMAHDGKECHLNGALSCVELLIALYYCWLKISPHDLRNPSRDRFIFSKGHACTALYAVLADLGFIPVKELHRYAEGGSPLPSHLCRHALPILEWSSGSLGHGLGVGTGMGYGLKLDGLAGRAVVLLSDGECNEGSVWEAAMFASSKRLDNVLAVVDYNGIQSIGRTDDLTGGASFAEKFRAFGWSVQEVDGHNIEAVVDALNNAQLGLGRPCAIIARTVAGAGISFMEDQVLWHYRTPSDDDLRKALSELAATPIHLQEKCS